MPMTATLNNGKMVNISKKSKMGGAGEDNYSTDADGNVIENMPKFFGGAITPQVKNGKLVGMFPSSQLSQGQEPTPSQAENHSSMMQELLKGRRGRGIV